MFCTNCGGQLMSTGQRFCGACGAAIQQATGASTESSSAGSPDNQESAQNSVDDEAYDLFEDVSTTIEEHLATAKDVLSHGDLKAAEERIVRAYEVSAPWTVQRDACINQWIEDVCLPRHRYEEADIWAVWLSSTDDRDALRTRIARERAQSGGTALSRLPSNRTWQSSDVHSRSLVTDDQQYHYDRFIKYLSETDALRSAVETMRHWMPASFAGVMWGNFTADGESLATGCARDTVAMAIRDYAEYLLMGAALLPTPPETARRTIVLGATQVTSIAEVVRLLETALSTVSSLDDPQGSYRAVGRRFLFEFPGSVMLVRTGDSETCIHGPSNPDITVLGLDSSDWHWSDDTKSWIAAPDSSGTEAFIGVVGILTTRLGVPRLVLPWGRALEEYRDDPEGALEWLGDEEDDDSMSDEFAAVQGLFAQLAEHAQNPGTLAGMQLRVVDEDELLPQGCSYYRFDTMLGELATSGWIVVYDECCGTCARGSIEDAREAAGLPVTAPTFVTWEQNARHYYFATGAIAVDHYLESPEVPEHEKFLEQLAQKYGLSTKIVDDGNRRMVFA